MFRFLLISICILIFSQKNYAWSKEGHHIVAQIAKNYLKQSTLDSIQKYFKDLSFEDAACWMDEVKKDENYKYLYNWHFVNIAPDASYVKTEIPNIINQLELAIQNLHQKKDVFFNLKVIFHLIGDLHQPLHTGYASDKGGNTKSVQYFNKSTNLHYVWDELIIKSEKIDASTCLILAKTIPLNNHIIYNNGNVLEWAIESRMLLKNVYQIKNDYISHAYINRNATVIELQLLKAGIRLAEVLDAVFKK